MQMYEVIRTIEGAGEDNIQDLLQAVMGRYRQLYPQWRMLFISADPNNADERNQEFLELISRAEQIAGTGECRAVKNRPLKSTKIH